MTLILHGIMLIASMLIGRFVEDTLFKCGLSLLA